MRYVLLLIAFLALSGFSPMFPTPQGFIDIDAIRTAELIAGDLVVVIASGDSLTIPTSQKAGMISILTDVANFPGLMIWTKPAKVINLSQANWALYVDPNVKVGWSNGDLETFTGAEADSIIAKEGVLRGLGTK